jgi:hypothetical protein
MLSIGKGSAQLAVSMVLCFVATFPLVAQVDTSSIVIAGTVVDPSKEPIGGAEIRVVGTDHSILTSVTGTFRLMIPRAKEIPLLVRRPGFNAQLLTLAGTWTGTIVLAHGNFQLPEISVTSRYGKPEKYAATTLYDDFFRRRRIGLGEFIDRDQIDRRSPLQTVEILQGRPGIRVSVQPAGVRGGNVVAFARCNEIPQKINVYLDGKKLMQDRVDEKPLVSDQPLTFMSNPGIQTATEDQLEARRRLYAVVGEMLSRINPHDIEMIEIFRGPGELPAEFNDGNCGAIVVWTRKGIQ